MIDISAYSCLNFKWARILYEYLSVFQSVSESVSQSHFCIENVRFCVLPPCAILCPHLCVSVSLDGDIHSGYMRMQTWFQFLGARDDVTVLTNQRPNQGDKMDKQTDKHTDTHTDLDIVTRSL